jgi:hypothetical protein
LHQGTLYLAVAIHWLEVPLLLARRNGMPRDEARLVLASQMADAFRRPTESYQERVIARAKRRPAVVLSTQRELSRGDAVRVAPLYGINRSGALFGRRDAIRRGEIAPFIYVPPLPSMGLQKESVISLYDVQVVSRSQLRRPAACLSATGLHGVLSQYTRYAKERTQPYPVHAH